MDPELMIESVLVLRELAGEDDELALAAAGWVGDDGEHWLREMAKESGDREAAKALVRAELPRLCGMLKHLSDRLPREAPMFTKAFPPKKKPDEGEQPDEAPDKQQPDPTKPDPAQPDRHADGPDLAATIATLTTAIVNLQEMVQPKEAPASNAPPPPAPGDAPPPPDAATDPDADGDGIDDADEEPDLDAQPPVDDPKKRKRDEEDGRAAMDRYRRAGKPAATKGYKRAGKQHVECMKAAADHLDALAGMEPGEKWTPMHRDACKHHCASVRKAMGEMSGAEGGSTVEPQSNEPPPPPDAAQTKAVAQEAAREALTPLSEAIFRLTGRRVG